MKKHPIEVVVDEGGFRCTSPNGSVYVRHEDLVDASLEETWLGGTRFVLERRDGELVRVPLLPSSSAVAFQRVALHEIHARKGRPPSPLAARGDRALLPWLEGALAACQGTYRDASVARDELAALLDDPIAPIDARATAAYVLLATDGDDDLVTTLRAFFVHAMPPLVLVAARVAPGGSGIVDDALLDAIAPFLAAEDVEAARAATGEDGVARIKAALARAREALEREAPPDGAHDHGPRRLTHPTASSGSGDRWVGRTWSL